MDDLPVCATTGLAHSMREVAWLSDRKFRRGREDFSAGLALVLEPLAAGKRESGTDGGAPTELRAARMGGDDEGYLEVKVKLTVTSFTRLHPEHQDTSQLINNL